MSKEFDVNSKVNFPYKIVSKDIDGYHIVIAPDYPNWIVLDDWEYEIFRILSNNTIIDGLNEYYAAFPGNTEDDCVLAFTNLPLFVLTHYVLQRPAFMLSKAPFENYESVLS